MMQQEFSKNFPKMYQLCETKIVAAKEFIVNAISTI